MKIKRMNEKKETRTRPDLASRAIGAQERMQIKQLIPRSEPLEKKPIKMNEISSQRLVYVDTFSSNKNKHAHQFSLRVRENRSLFFHDLKSNTSHNLSNVIFLRVRDKHLASRERRTLNCQR